MIDHKKRMEKLGKQRVYDALTNAKIAISNAEIIAEVELSDEEWLNIRELANRATELMAKAQTTVLPGMAWERFEL